ncbi:MAG: hypothetical protein O3C43_00660 [Verrucomicrobia bacterium]|nr:hypothetical protein [Verrucomicrobiota bacterium]
MESGAPLGNSTIDEILAFGSGGYNRAGIVVFAATLADGSLVLAATDGIEVPDHEPIEGHRWINAEGGSFATASNWSDFNENQIADDVPGPDDNAIFDLSGTYPVLVGTQSVNRLVVGGDPNVQVEFISADLNAQALSPEEPSVLVDKGSFKLSNGNILSSHTKIGTTAQTTVHVTGSETQWNNTGRFTVGILGAPTVFVENGATITSAETVFGDGANQEISRGHVIGVGSTWNIGTAQIGKQGDGLLVASSGGQIIGEEVLVGGTAGSNGLLVSTGNNSEALIPSQIRLFILRLGMGGSGDPYCK